MTVDLHTHSNASDGSLTPVELLARAFDCGVTVLALTDHDTLRGYQLARAEMLSYPEMTLIAGIELSCVWQKRTLHVVGLAFDAANPAFVAQVKAQEQGRLQRAEIIDQRLSKHGLVNGLEAALKLAGGGVVGRPHFAQVLVEQGIVKSQQQAFDRYLGAGKIGDVKIHWPEMATVVDWIKQADGMAVLAHPARYKLTNSKLRQLLVDFKHCGGQAVEVVSGQNNNEKREYLAAQASELGFYASAGSDFHHPDLRWQELGKYTDLPGQCRPIWDLWD